MKEDRQVEMFEQSDISTCEVERPRPERTTHGKKYHRRYVEIGHRPTGKKMTGWYYHIISSPEFRFWSDDDKYAEKLGPVFLTKKNWVVLREIKREESDGTLCDRGSVTKQDR